MKDYILHIASGSFYTVTNELENGIITVAPIDSPDTPVATLSPDEYVFLPEIGEEEFGYNCVVVEPFESGGFEFVPGQPITLHCFGTKQRVYGISSGSVMVQVPYIVGESHENEEEIFVPQEFIRHIPYKTRIGATPPCVGDHVLLKGDTNNARKLYSVEGIDNGSAMLRESVDGRFLRASVDELLAIKQDDIKVGDVVRVYGTGINANRVFMGERAIVQNICADLATVSFENKNSFPFHTSYNVIVGGCVRDYDIKFNGYINRVPEFHQGDIITRKDGSSGNYYRIVNEGPNFQLPVMLVASSDPNASFMEISYKQTILYKLCDDIPDDCYVECCYSKRTILRKDAVHDGKGHFVSAEYEDKVTRCHDCGSFVTQDNKVIINEGYPGTFTVCQDCAIAYPMCYHCDCRVTDDNMSENGDYCVYCMENASICDECGDVIFCEDDIYYDDDTNEVLCYQCYNRRRQSGCIRDYSYKPYPVFKSVLDDTTFNGFTYHADSDASPVIYMGVEDEIDKGNDPGITSRELSNIAKGLIYLKHDGSLEDNGIEIVSHPCTLSYHANVFPWKELFNCAARHDYTSHDADTCGLHVHVNRDCLGSNSDKREATIAKIAILFHRFWSDILIFSRRKSDQLTWCKPHNVRMSRSDDENDEKAYAKKIVENIPQEDHSDRYQALNLLNSATIEFRVFRGTLKHSTFLATLQFVNNVVDYARNTSIKQCLICNWMDFAAYRRYPELMDYMRARGIVDNAGREISYVDAPKFSTGDIVVTNDEFRQSGSRCVYSSFRRRSLSRSNLKILNVYPDYFSSDYNSPVAYEVIPVECHDEEGNIIPLPDSANFSVILPEDMVELEGGDN